MLRGEAGAWTRSQIPSSVQGCCSQVWLGADEGARAAPTVATGLVPALLISGDGELILLPFAFPFSHCSSEAKIAA